MKNNHMITNKNSFEILNDEKLNKSFLSATLRDININCKIYKGNFFADSFNYFPITEDFEVFHDLYKIQNDNSIDHFYSDNFVENLKKNLTNLKNFNDVYLLGSSPGDNYFSNLIYFLPRLFFYNKDKIKLGIHRNLSNKFRNFIIEICSNLNKKITFTFLDDEFYKFQDSFAPQFLKIEESIKILNFFLNNHQKRIEEKTKLYISYDEAGNRKEECNIIAKKDSLIKLKKTSNIYFDLWNAKHVEIAIENKSITKYLGKNDFIVRGSFKPTDKLLYLEFYNY